MMQVLRQVEYYFSDENLRRDSFMRGKLEACAEAYVDLPLLVPIRPLLVLPSLMYIPAHPFTTIFRWAPPCHVTFFCR